jgi:hypothetical protein
MARRVSAERARLVVFWWVLDALGEASPQTPNNISVSLALLVFVVIAYAHIQMMGVLLLILCKYSRSRAL